MGATEKMGKIRPKHLAHLHELFLSQGTPGGDIPYQKVLISKILVYSAHFCIACVQYKPGKAGIYAGFVTFLKRPSCLGPQKPVKGNCL